MNWKKCTIVALIVACLIATFAYLAFQPITATEIEDLGERTYAINEDMIPAIWGFHSKYGDTLHYKIGSDEPVGICMYYSSEEIEKISQGNYSPPQGVPPITEIDDQTDLCWEGDVWLVVCSEVPSTITIKLTLERQVTKLRYETWR